MPVQAVLFDLDGVISDTTPLHSKAWKAVLDDVLNRSGRSGAPFSEESEYPVYFDGKTRRTGIESFFLSRHITLPLEGEEGTAADAILAIGNAKNAVFHELLMREGAHVFDDAVRLIARARAAGLDLGLASSSKNARAVLTECGLRDSFKVIVDGLYAEEHRLASKPSPDFYARAAALIGHEPGHCAVLEDAISGVRSAKWAGIGIVVGVARKGNAADLRSNGADIVVASLDELSL